MVTRSARVALLGGLVVFALATVSGTSVAGSAHRGGSAKAGRLVAFGSCGALLGYVKARAERDVGPWGFGAVATASPGPTTTREVAPKQGVDFSGTNVQEEGVDEPDLVKTNGETLFAVANGRLNAVDVAGERPRLLDTLKLDSGWSHELLLHGDRLLVLSRGGYWAEPLPGIAARLAPFVPSKSVIWEVDVSSPKALRIVRTLTLDGAYVAARLVGKSVRLVASSQVPETLPFERPVDDTPEARDSAQQHNRAVVASSGTRELAPAVPDHPARQDPRQVAPPRAVPARESSGGVFRPRDAHRPDVRPLERARAGGLRRGDD